jgi:hypothetical protein
MDESRTILKGQVHRNNLAAVENVVFLMFNSKTGVVSESIWFYG